MVTALLVLAFGGAALWWVHRPMAMPQAPLELSVERGMLPRQVADAVRQAGVDVSPDLLYAWFRFSGQARDIKAGSYELEADLTPHALLGKLSRGEETLQAVTLIEGWTFRQVREALAKQSQLRQDGRDLSDAELMARLGRPGQHPEGRFFPDTYRFSKGSSDLAVLRRAMGVMDRRLEWAWTQRSPAAAVSTPEQALILASIIEKETGQRSERAEVSAVFNNRLRIGMPLQTDPTVIYGIGPSFDGNLRRRDLQTDTPWNTYTRPGLPPTPIAMPGRESLVAAVQPADSKALYFVSRGDGTSQFSGTLDEHNRAVNQYQRKR
nr:endolytic transglycosylase MltG [Ramlibacter aurantiacus]